MERLYGDVGHILKIFPKLLICDSKIDFVGCLGWFAGFFKQGLVYLVEFLYGKLKVSNQLLAE